MEILDILLIGAGPAGLSCAIEAKQAGMTCILLDKGSVVNSIRQFQHSMSFFSTPELLEIGGIPFVVPTTRPTTIDCVNYYRRVAEHFNLPLRSHETVDAIVRDSDGVFSVTTSRARTYRSRSVVFATGYYDWPRQLGVEGEDLPHVRHYYREPYSYHGSNVLVVGGKNSAVEAALDLFRHGAKVTLVHRGPSLSPGVKYWILPDVENRIKEGSIRALFNSRVEAFSAGETFVMQEGAGSLVLPTDFAFVLVGYAPDMTLLRSCGVQTDPETAGPVFNPETMETDVPGLFVAGGIAGGRLTNRIFIENGREHGKRIVRFLAGRS